METESSSLLDALTSAEAFALKPFLCPMSFEPGTVLFNQGEPPAGCFLIEEGKVALTNQLPGGRVTMAGLVDAGDILGESALISSVPRGQTATAIGSVRALFIESKNLSVLRSLLNPLHAPFVLRVAQGLAQRMMNTLALLPLVDDPLVPAGHPLRLPLGDREQPGSSVDLKPFFPLLPCFRDFTTADVEALLAESRIWEVPRGRWLFAVGEMASSCFITLRGACETRFGNLPPGRRIGLWGPGKIIDPIELILRGTRRLDCRAREQSTILTFPHAVFDRLLDQRSPVALKILNATTFELLERSTRSTRVLATRDIARQLGL